MDWQRTDFRLSSVQAPSIVMPRISERVAKDGLGVFTSYGAALRQYGFPLAVEVFKASGINPQEVDHFFTHSSSKKDWTEGSVVLGMRGRLYDIYATHGNVISAAVPAAMALAVKDGTLRRGDRIAALVASAGMSSSATSFVF